MRSARGSWKGYRDLEPSVFVPALPWSAQWPCTRNFLSLGHRFTVYKLGTKGFQKGYRMGKGVLTALTTDILVWDAMSDTAHALHTFLSTTCLCAHGVHCTCPSTHIAQATGAGWSRLWELPSANDKEQLDDSIPASCPLGMKVGSNLQMWFWDQQHQHQCPWELIQSKTLEIQPKLCSNSSSGNFDVCHSLRTTDLHCPSEVLRGRTPVAH